MKTHMPGFKLIIHNYAMLELVANNLPKSLLLREYKTLCL